MLVGGVGGERHSVGSGSVTLTPLSWFAGIALPSLSPAALSADAALTVCGGRAGPRRPLPSVLVTAPTSGRLSFHIAGGGGIRPCADVSGG